MYEDTIFEVKIVTVYEGFLWKTKLFDTTHSDHANMSYKRKYTENDDDVGKNELHFYIFVYGLYWRVYQRTEGTGMIALNNFIIVII